MERIRDNVSYGNFVICPKCGERINYHVTDVKGVNPKYIICTVCDSIVEV